MLKNGICVLTISRTRKCIIWHKLLKKLSYHLFIYFCFAAAGGGGIASQAATARLMYLIE